MSDTRTHRVCVYSLLLCTHAVGNTNDFKVGLTIDSKRVTASVQKAAMSPVASCTALSFLSSEAEEEEEAAEAAEGAPGAALA